MSLICLDSMCAIAHSRMFWIMLLHRFPSHRLDFVFNRGDEEYGGKIEREVTWGRVRK